MRTFRVIWRVVTDPSWSPPWSLCPYRARLFRRVLLAVLAGCALCLIAYALAFAALWDGSDGRLYDAAHVLTGIAFGCAGYIGVLGVLLRRHKRRCG